MSGGHKAGSIILKVVGIVLLLLAAVLIATPFLFDANQFRPRLESEITQAIGREVKVGSLKLSLFSGGVAADNITIADDAAFSPSPFVQAHSLRIGVGLRPLIFSRVVRITAIELERPEIALFHSASGAWNFSTIGGKGKATPKSGGGSTAPTGTDISIGRLDIILGRVTITSAGERQKAPHVYSDVNISARDISLSSVFPFSLTAKLPGGGGLKLEGKAGPLNVEDASLTAFMASIDVTRFDLTASGFVDPEAGLGGLVNFSGDLTSDGTTLRSKGKVQAEKIQIVKGGTPASQPVSLDYVISHDLQKQSGTLSKAEVRLAKAVASMSGTYARKGGSVVLTMKLIGDNMPAQDLEAMLPPLGITLPKGSSIQGGILSVDLETEGEVEKLVTTGALNVSNIQLAGFDLGAKMATVASLAGIHPSPVTQIEKLVSDVRIAPDGIQISGLSLIVPSLGELSGNGTVGSNSSLDFKMLARLHTSGGVVGGLAQIVGGKRDNDLGIPFFVRGTTSNPAFVPDAKGVANSLLNSVISKKGAQDGSGGSGQNLGDTLRSLFGKKK